MTLRRPLLAALLLAAALFAALASGGYSAAEMDRGAEISVVDHDDALVKVPKARADFHEYENDEGETVSVCKGTDVTVENQLGRPITVEWIGPRMVNTPLPADTSLHRHLDSCPGQIDIHVTGFGIFATITVDVDGT